MYFSQMTSIWFSMMLFSCLIVLPIYAQGNFIETKLGEPFNLKVNQTAYISSANIVIKLLNVKEDSRCPIGAECIWQGQVILYLSLINNTDIRNFDITSGSGGKELVSKIADGYEIKVIKVEPYPIRGKEISPQDYDVTMEVYRVDIPLPNHTIPEFPINSVVFLASIFVVILFHRIKN